MARLRAVVTRKPYVPCEERLRGLRSGPGHRSGVDATPGPAGRPHLTISLDPDADVAELRAALEEADPEQLVLAPWITSEAIDGLKFSECLPRHRAVKLVARRLADPAAVAIARGEQLNAAHLGGE